MSEGGECDRNMWNVLKGLMKFVVVDGNTCMNFKRSSYCMRQCCRDLRVDCFLEARVFNFHGD